MPTDTTTVDPSGIDAQLPTDVVFDLLSDARRRYALYYLSQRVGAITLEELVDGVVHHEGPVTDDQFVDVTLSFQHNHLGKLVDAGVVRYEPATTRIDREPAATALDPYLELVFDGGASS
ncbi:DUF7344 domain-containing protein [Natrarchaeobaculum aegyptiacum]|uniref:DUF7344 domain-containing protein n=1 Tax=Natrarchaeobaculum aegyptiacum TaxID=745377 RepID=A0A2Z2HYY5_9EURY|nr:hypothetical protein [Natrarchaeobaculum aegyptiacum]ARS90374.1 hypothetical protein B1756_11980 [Natrarchaeobaculum aegyptiacum]